MRFMRVDMPSAVIGATDWLRFSSKNTRSCGLLIDHQLHRAVVLDEDVVEPPIGEVAAREDRSASWLPPNG